MLGKIWKRDEEIAKANAEARMKSKQTNNNKRVVIDAEFTEIK